MTDGTWKQLEDGFKAQTPRGRLLKVAQVPRLKAEAEALLALFPDFASYPVRDGFEMEHGIIEWQISTLEQRAARWREYQRWAEQVARDEARQRGTRKKRKSRWPELDEWIAANWTPDLTAASLWDKLPDSFEADSFYRDGDEIIELDSGRTLTFSGFRKRLASVKGRMLTG
jgi:hypothetical protein